MKKTNNNRISSIDTLRGIVMVLMVLDHVRMYFHKDAFMFNPADLSQSKVILFWTRFITHFCAPIFVFLAGTSAFFVSQRKRKKETSFWLLKRGIWLVLAEITIIKLAWTFQLDYNTIVLQVIWVLGIGMMLLAAFIHFPKRIMIITSLLVVFGHNILDSFPIFDTTNYMYVFLHKLAILNINDMTVFAAYPLIPWVFLMPLGYYLGELYHKKYSKKHRKEILLYIGAICIALFLLLRGFTNYGDPNLWSEQSTLGLTVASFFNASKYPPSLLYLLITIGPSLLFLGLFENWNNKLSNKLEIIGRVPMFFYILHLYVIHLLALIAALVTGFDSSSMIIDLWVTMQKSLKGYGFNLLATYIIWLFVTISLYPLCEKYNEYKTNNRTKWWLSYL